MLAALPPIALGHAISISVIVTLLWLLQISLPVRAVRYGAAALLVGFGLHRLVRARHPNWAGMRVGFWDLTLWSFLMASAHGAGLMLVPLLLPNTRSASLEAMAGAAHLEHAQHASHLSGLTSPIEIPAVVGVHSAGHLIVAALIAFLVYEKLGLALLRKAWFNLDLLWVIALVLSGLLILFI